VSDLCVEPYTIDICPAGEIVAAVDMYL